jgi:hypothetical protein
MIAWFKKLCKSKLQINITIITPAEGVNHITEAVVIERDVLNIVRKRDSNYRFVEEHKVEHNGKETKFWVTEERIGKDWRKDYDTFACDKETALALHLALVERGTLKEASHTKTVLWEGLNLDETRVWVNLQK